MNPVWTKSRAQCESVVWGDPGPVPSCFWSFWAAWAWGDPHPPWVPTDVMERGQSLWASAGWGATVQVCAVTVSSDSDESEWTLESLQLVVQVLTRACVSWFHEFLIYDILL